MSLLPEIIAMKDEVAGWRRHLHERPELLFDVNETSAFVAEKLKEFGCDEIVIGMGRTGVVGLIRGRPGGNGPTVGLRADMDALPITEITGAPWASRTPGKMHACGHDGHTAMLLGAAQHLAKTRNFNGAVAVIFQPAEEGGGGGREMVKDGLMERFGISKVFGMHNMPGLPVGQFAIRQGAIMASTDEFRIKLTGRGGHAAMPHKSIDPIVAGSAIVMSIQTIASRNADPLQSVVVSVTKFLAGTAYNIIPEEVELAGTIRTLNADMRKLAVDRLRKIVESVAAAHDVVAEFHHMPNYPVTFNHAAETEFAGDIAAAISGGDAVDRNVPPTMGGEDFSYMLEARPGAFIFMGNGDTAGLHHPAYDFNDEAIPHGVSYWVRLVETSLAD